MERVENSRSLTELIKDELKDIEIDTLFETATFEDDIISKIVDAMNDAEFEVKENGNVAICNKQEVAIEAYRANQKDIPGVEFRHC